MSKLIRFGVRAAVVFFIVGGIDGDGFAGAQEITEFRNGYITFTNDNPSLFYRIEFRPNLTDAVDWDGSYRDLRNINSPDAEVTVPVGMFFRVVGSETPWVAGTASASDLLSGQTAYVDDEEITGTMANVGQQNITPGTEAQTITAGYHDGTGSVAGDTDLVAGNIKKDVTIFGVSGSSSVVDTSSGDAVAGDILTGKTAWVDGAEVTGTASIPAYPGEVPKTGQASGFTAGDDGDLQRGVAWPDPRFTDNSNGTVTDNLTGLMWVKAPHSLSGNSDAMNWHNAIDFCNNLTHAGHSDWRLPNVRELQSLIDYGRSLHVSLPWEHPFIGVQSDDYWSSSSHPEETTMYAWVVHLSIGGVHSGFKSFPDAYVWPVRGGQ